MNIKKTIFIFSVCYLLFSCETDTVNSTNTRGKKQEPAEDSIKTQNVDTNYSSPKERLPKTLKTDTLLNNKYYIDIKVSYSNGDVYRKVFHKSMGQISYTSYRDSNNVLRSAGKYGKNFIKKDSMNKNGEIIMRITTNDTLIVFDELKYKNLNYSRFVYGGDTLFGYSKSDLN